MGIDLEVKVLPEVVTATEVNRKGGPVRDRLEEAGSEPVGRRTETGSEAGPSRASGLDTAKLS
jgi:hypothetical protein